MYRVAIVDDERIVKLAVQSMIDWEGLELAGTASDGAEALELARREIVDIVVTDLKMAGMDGLELLAELRRLEPPPEVIVLSNFGDFGYVREALKGGALDYILKTDISRETLMACIREAMHRLDSRGLSESRSRARGSFLLEAEAGAEGLLEAFRLADREARNRGAAIRGALLAFAPDADSDRPADGALRALAPQGLKSCLSCAISASEGAGLFLMPLFEEGSPFDPGSAASWLADQARLYYGLLAGVAWSPPFADEAGLEEAFLGASRAAELFFYSANAGAALESSSRRPPARAVLDELERALPGPGRASADPMRELRAVVARAADLDLPPGFLKAVAARSAAFLLAGSEASAEAIAAIEAAPSDALLIEAYAAAVEPGEPRAAGPRVCRAEVRRILERLDADVSARVSVPDLAREAGLSESYLCTIFKAQAGKSIVGYVNDKRLDRAMDLLRTGRYLVKEAASEVGLEDPFYFNRLFKRRFGVAPSSVIPPG